MIQSHHREHEKQTWPMVNPWIQVGWWLVSAGLESVRQKQLVVSWVLGGHHRVGKILVETFVDLRPGYSCGPT